MTIPEAITDRLVDGKYYIDSYPEHILVSEEVFDRADPTVMQIHGDRLNFTPENQKATYRLGEWEPGIRARHAFLLAVYQSSP